MKEFLFQRDLKRNENRIVNVCKLIWGYKHHISSLLFHFVYALKHLQIN